MRYHVAEPNSYLVITGASIDGVQIKKKAWVLPLQKCTKISITPFDLSMTLHAMTMEKLNFSLPAVFTIGPKDNLESISRYATLLTGESDGTPSTGSRKRSVVTTGRNHVQDICKGIIEGETRSIVSTMTMEELFRERKVFRDKILTNIQSELDHFGLFIYNANVKELQDGQGSDYFKTLSRKAHESAINQAKIDVAEARARGEIGEAEKLGKSKQEIAKINATTAVLETERKKEKATADSALTQREISIEKEINLERIAAKRAAETRDVELQKTVETKRAEMELERLRATTVTQSKIKRESAEQQAQAELFAQQKRAEGQKFQQIAEAEAQATAQNKEAEAFYMRKAKETDASTYRTKNEATASFEKSARETDAATYRVKNEAAAGYERASKEADADAYRKHKAAEANFFARSKEAEANYLSMKAEADGMREMAQAYSEMAEAFGGPQGLLCYLALKDNMYEKLALANAQAINGLQPKISIWETGSKAGDGSNSFAPIQNIMQSLPPLLSTIKDQTGMMPPSWLMQMDQSQSQSQPQQQQGDSSTAVAKKPLTNGVSK